MRTQKCRLTLIDPNPFRSTGELAYREDALRALGRSLRAHGDWSSLVVRPSPQTPGRFESAFGHHRVEALRRLHGDDHEITVQVADLTDTQMVQLMAAENGPEYAGDALTYMQQVRAAVVAFGEGRITLAPVPRKTRKTGIRYAPLYVPVDDRSDLTDDRLDKAYTANTVAAFLGYNTRDAKGRMVAKPFVKEVLLALEAVERGEVDEAAFRRVSLTAMRGIRLAAMRKAAPEQRPSNAPGGPSARAAEEEPEPAKQPEDDLPRAPAPESPPERRPLPPSLTPPAPLPGPPSGTPLTTPLAPPPAPPSEFVHGATEKLAPAPRAPMNPAPPAESGSGNTDNLVRSVAKILRLLPPRWPQKETDTMYVADAQLPTMKVMSDVCAYVRRVRPPPVSEQSTAFVMLLRDLHGEIQDLLTAYYGGFPSRRR